MSYQEEFDAIITSPPFGEEKNTIGYARWSRPYMSWLRLNGKILQNEDKLALGSKVSKDVEKNLKEIPSITASTLLRKVLEKDRQRVSDAVTFFFDYLKTLQEMYRVLKPSSWPLGFSLAIAIDGRASYRYQYFSGYGGSRSIRETEPSGILASIVGSRKSPQ